MTASAVSDPYPLADAPSDVLAVLPLLYVAWADGILTPSEIKEIQEAIRQQDWMNEEHREQVCSWLDPSDPPTATEYFRWRRAIKKAAEQIPNANERPLAELGLEMARLAGNGIADRPEVRRALSDLESALGIVGQEAVRELLVDRPSPAAETTGERQIDVEAMKQLLDGRHADLRDRIRTLLCDPAFRYEPHLSTEAYRERVLSWCQLLADQGLGALSFPEHAGGEGDIEQFIVAFETLAYHDLSLVVKFGVQFGLFGGSILNLGTERHHKEYLERIGKLELPGGFAMSELGHGSNVREMETTARYDAETEEFVINTPSNSARKEWIGNAAAHGRMVTVFAQLEIDGTEYGVHAFLVPIRDENGMPLPRVRIADCGQKVGLNGVDNGRLWFDQVRIPRENMLDRFATVESDGTYHSPIPSAGKRFFKMLSTLVGGRISVAASALSAAKSGLTIAIRYADRRRQFGPSDEPEVLLLDYPTHQRRLLPLLANAYGLDFAISDLVRRFGAREPHDDMTDIEGHAAALKVLSTWNTTHTLQEAREACGGQGYLDENRLGRLKADTDVFTTFEGDNTVLLLQVAKGLLASYQQEFADMNFFGLVKHLAGRAVSRASELNPVFTRNTDRSHLRDPEFHQTAFSFREESLLHSAARRLKQRIDDGMDTYDAFIECQTHLVTLAEAHAKRLVVDAFVENVAECDDEELREALALLESLYALHHLEQDRGWFLEQGYFSGAKSKAIRDEVEALCAELRPMAGDLVDAFAIPDELLAAPIATSNGRASP